MRNLFLAAALLLGSTTAFADTKPAPAARTTIDASKMANDDCARARKANKTCVIDMGKGDDIEGNSPTAGGSAIGIIQFGKAESLIRVRKDFIVEILKSAEDID
jgi:hypothetical protein